MDRNRREFLAAVRAGVVCAGAAALLGRSAGAQAAVTRAPLALPPSNLRASYDVVVVGSGYGGAIAAGRLAGTRSVCVLERGREWPPDQFPAQSAAVLAQLRSSANPLGLYDYRAGADLDVLVGNGLGGTSLINANVVIAADRDVFTRSPWPQAIRTEAQNGALATHEARVRQALAVQRVGAAHALRKQWLHRSTTQRRRRAGAAVDFRELDLAVRLDGSVAQPNAYGVSMAPCTHCGDCVSGCRVGAKGTLDTNYLALARQRGAELYTRIEVEHVTRQANGRWLVHYLARPATGAAYRATLDTRSVVLGAGALGSTEILLRSRAQGLRVADALGTRFSANGDVLGLAYNTEVQSNAQGFGVAAAPAGMRRSGPTITGAASYASSTIEQRYLIEEGAVPSALVDALRLALPVAAGIPQGTQDLLRIEHDLAGRGTTGALNHSMVYLGIGHDSAAGRLRLDALQRLELAWPGVGSEGFVARIRQEMDRHARSFEGQYVDSPRTHPLFGAAMTTVHPLGGCPMAETRSTGVVDADGRVFDPGGGPTAVHAGLYVMDGSIVPTSLGVNPLLTIAALAERAAARFTG